MRLISRIGVAWTFGVFLFGGTGAWAAQVPSARVRDAAAFTIADVPARPLELYERALRLTPPVLSTGAYAHAGAEYGIVVSGRIMRLDTGRMRMLEQGESFASPLGSVSKSRASGQAVQISAFLGPRGARPETTRAVSIFQNRFAVTAPPTPFTLIEQLVDIYSEGSTIRFAYGGAAYCTVADGEIAVEKNSVLSRYRLGESFVVAAGEIVRFVSVEKRPGSVQVVVLLPEAVHLTRPSRAY